MAFTHIDSTLTRYRRRRQGIMIRLDKRSKPTIGLTHSGFSTTTILRTDTLFVLKAMFLFSHKFSALDFIFKDA